MDIATLSRFSFRPCGPGGYLRRALNRAGLTQEGLAELIMTSRFTINQIVKGKRNVTPTMALKLSKALGTSVDVWLNLQRDVDLFDAYQEVRLELDAIQPAKLDPVVIHELSATPSEIDNVADDRLAVAFQSLDEADFARLNKKTAVCVFGPDQLEQIGKSEGLGEVSVVLDRFTENLKAFAKKRGLIIFHYSYEALAAIPETPESSNLEYIEKMFTEFPTAVQGSRTELKLTLSGGIARPRQGASVEDTADDAADIMYEVRRFRSGEQVHRWADKLRD
jgi:addiction module HigA family antidote